MKKTTKSLAMTRKKSLSFECGFTLVEVLITAAIIGIMTSATFVSIQRGKIDKEVRVVAEQVASAIREAQNYALSGKQPSATDTACGFGFRRSTATAYDIFYNHTTATTVDCGDIVKYYSTTIPNDVSDSFYSSDIVLPNGVSFFNNAATGVANLQKVYFLIPFANVHNFDGSPSTNVKTFLVRKDPITYAICVSPIGVVEIEKVEGDVAVFICAS